MVAMRRVPSGSVPAPPPTRRLGDWDEDPFDLLPRVDTISPRAVSPLRSHQSQIMSPLAWVAHHAHAQLPERQSLPSDLRLTQQGPSGIFARVHVPTDAAAAILLGARQHSPRTHSLSPPPLPVMAPGPAHLSLANAIATAEAGSEQPLAGSPLQRRGSVGMNPWVDGPSATAATAAAAAATHRHPGHLNILQQRVPSVLPGTEQAGPRAANSQATRRTLPQTFSAAQQAEAAAASRQSPVSVSASIPPAAPAASASVFVSASIQSHIPSMRLPAQETTPADGHSGFHPHQYSTQHIGAPDSGFRATRPAVNPAILNRAYLTSPFPPPANTVEPISEIPVRLHQNRTSGTDAFSSHPSASTQLDSTEYGLPAQHGTQQSLRNRAAQSNQTPTTYADLMEESDEGDEDVDEWGVGGNQWLNSIYANNITGSTTEEATTWSDSARRSNFTARRTGRERHPVSGDLDLVSRRFRPSESGGTEREVQRSPLEQRWLERGEVFDGRRVRQRANGVGDEARDEEVRQGEGAGIIIYVPAQHNLSNERAVHMLQQHEQQRMRQQQQQMQELAEQRRVQEQELQPWMQQLQQLQQQQLLLEQQQPEVRWASPPSRQVPLAPPVNDDPVPPLGPFIMQDLQLRTRIPECKPPEVIPRFKLPVRTVQPCSYLAAGQTFRGIQTLSPTPPRSASLSRLSSSSPDEWTVEVRLQHVDLQSSYICGVMLATSAVPGFYNPPRTVAASTAAAAAGLGSEPQKPIVTFFEGEIVDNREITFLTRKWAAGSSTDAAHWERMEGWDGVKATACKGDGLAEGLAESPCIYMRWKEQFFVSMPPGCCLLTIEGFYYIALNRQTGALHGLYYDPDSVPFQELRLNPDSSCNESGRAQGSSASRGQSFGSYQLA